MGDIVQVDLSIDPPSFVVFMGDGEYAVPVVYRLGKGPIAAYRSLRERCLIGGMNVSNGRYALWLTEVVDSSAEGELVSTIGFGTTMPVQELGHFTFDKSVSGGTLSAPREVALSNSVLAFYTVAKMEVYQWDYGPGKPTVIPWPIPLGIQDANMTVKGSEFVFSRDADPQYRALMHRRSDGQIVTLYSNPSRYFANLDSDGNELVWQEIVESSSPPPTEVWAASWPSGGAFNPRKVASLPEKTWFVRAGAAGGWFVYYKDDATLRAVRTSDGKYVDAKPPKGFGWGTPVGVFNGEIWSTIHFSPGHMGSYSVARVPIASLGAPR